jgi:hypothetical protein
MSQLQEGTQEVQNGSIAPRPRPQVRISDCKRMLKEGMDRKAIAAYYGIPVSTMAEKVWSHPELKGLKTKKVYELDLIDDTVVADFPEVAEVVDEQVDEEVVTTEANVAFSDMQAEVGEAEVAPTINDWGN